MKVALGLKAHSGWAALVAIGERGNDLMVVERRRLQLVEQRAEWAKQPYHAAEGLSSIEAKKLVKLGINSARRLALRETQTAIRRIRANGLEVSSCGLLMGTAMPDWSVDQILAVHFRMHLAEGYLFRDVLARAATKSDLRLVEIPEKSLSQRAVEVLKMPLQDVVKKIDLLGKSVGPPWGKDQKDASLAALIALHAPS